MGRAYVKKFKNEKAAENWLISKNYNLNRERTTIQGFIYEKHEEDCIKTATVIKTVEGAKMSIVTTETD